MTAEFFTIRVSIAALIISGTTLWFALLRRGIAKMTRPTQIYFGPDGSDLKNPKVYVRTLLYSTSQRGIVIENLYVQLSRDQSKQSFSIWVHGNGNGLTRGSGLFVGQQGVAVAHHFLAPPDSNSFEFSVGEYLIEIFAKVIGDDHAKLMFAATLNIDKEEAASLRDKNVGIYFDWGPHTNKYHSHLDRTPEKSPLLAAIARNLALDLEETK
jgi:hypothetical protein